jgi:hypothetical protein
MALSIKVPRKPRAAPKRVKYGLPACPVDKGFNACKYYFQYDVDRKILSDIAKKFIQEEFTKPEAKAILANPEYHFNLYTHLNAAIYWKNIDKEFDENGIKYLRRAKEYFGELIESGNRKLKESVNSETSATTVKASPQELLSQKIQTTIMVDLDQLEDDWTEFKKSDINVYELFKVHALKAVAVPIVKKRVDRWLSEYQDAYSKKCDQALEAYSHIPRSELKRRVGVIQGIIADLDKIRLSNKAVRKPRVPKARTADKQIMGLKYLKESNENKLMSINPIQVPGAHRLYAFNIKSRVLTEYICSSSTGFDIKGTTLSNFDSEKSKSIRLRKPEIFLPLVLSKTPKQVDFEWSKLTTKPGVPNGRINVDTILLKVTSR